jgi:hypothetical protein
VSEHSSETIDSWVNWRIDSPALVLSLGQGSGAELGGKSVDVEEG